MAYASKEKRDKYWVKYRKNNKEKVRDCHRRWYMKNRDRVLLKEKERHNQLSLQDKEKYTEDKRKYYLKNRDKILAERKKNSKRYNKKQRELSKKWRIKAIEFLGGKCIRCGFSDIRALQIDHINGGGNHDFAGSKTFHKKVIQDNKKTFQLLCANCNWIKRAENNENKKIVI